MTHSESAREEIREAFYAWRKPNTEAERNDADWQRRDQALTAAFAGPVGLATTVEAPATINSTHVFQPGEQEWAVFKHSE